MRARGQGVLAVVVLVIVLVAGVGLDRLGPKTPGSATPGEAPSGAWLCPHGGGTAWTAVVYLANPGTSDVTARLTSLTLDGARAPISVTVPAGGEVQEQVPAGDRSSSTYVEYFGGWIAAGWLTRGGGAEFGVGAEPCAPDAARLWYAPDNTTQQGQEADLVVMNPFGAEAVFDVVLYTATRAAPIRDSAFTDLSLKPGHSMALKLNAKAVGEQALTAELDVSAGRVAVASLGVNQQGGVRSSLGLAGGSARAYLPVAGGLGQSQLVIGVPGEQSATFTGTALSTEGPKPLAGLVGASQPPQSAKLYPLITAGPSAATLQTQDGAQVVAALRASGAGNDPAATSGVRALATAWVVTPTVAGEPSKPGLVLVNPGSSAVSVTLHLLAPQGATPASDVTVNVGAASTAGVPAAFLASAPGASVLVTADVGPIAALGASSSLGAKGIADYALAAGVPVPVAP